MTLTPKTGRSRTSGGGQLDQQPETEHSSNNGEQTASTTTARRGSTGDTVSRFHRAQLACRKNASSVTLSITETRRRLHTIRAAMSSVLGLGTERELESAYMRVFCQRPTGDERIICDSFQAFREDVQFLFRTIPVENPVSLREISQIQRMGNRSLFDVWYLYIIKEHDTEIGRRLREMNVDREIEGTWFAGSDLEKSTGATHPNHNQTPPEPAHKKLKLEEPAAVRRKGLTFNERLSELKLIGLATEGAKVVINEGHGEDEEDILVPFELSAKLKPHQVDGIHFMWNAVCGRGRNKHGAILAHSMGLGKSLQVITLIATLMTELTLMTDIERKREMIPEHLFSGHVVILCPATLIHNWRDEFDRWIPPGTPLRSVIGNVVTVNDSAQEDRYPELSRWFRSNGTLVLSYNMYRIYVGDALSSDDKLDRQMQEWLSDKVSLVIADEGHSLKNDATALYGILKRIQTPSRICLTGYPLQNRLEEYWCMIEWAAPSLLLGLDDFKQKFVKPITRGLYINSTSKERRESATKLRVLATLISSVVHRRESSILKNSLPPLHDFVLSCRLTELQRKLYKSLLAEIQEITTGTLNLSSFLARGRMLQLLCNHPRILQEESQARIPSSSSAAALDDDVSEGNKEERKPVVSHGEILDDQEDEDRIIGKGDREVFESLQNIFSSVHDVEALYHSHKANVMMSILDLAKNRREKVLVFARTLPTLDFIQRITTARGYDVFRIDSTTFVNSRQNMIADFNKKEGSAVFVISPQTAGVGVNLVSANRVVLFDIGWNPSLDEQAIARAYRFGQEHQVFVYRLGTRGTWEEVLLRNNIHKVGLAMRAVDNVGAERRFELKDLKTYFAMPPPEFETRLPNPEDIEDPILKSLLFRHRAGLVDVLNHEVVAVREEEEEVDHKWMVDLLKEEETRLKQSGRESWWTLPLALELEGNSLNQEMPALALHEVPTQCSGDLAPRPPSKEEYINEDEPLYKYLDGEGSSTVVASVPAVVQPVDEQDPDISTKWTGLANKPPEPASVRESPVPFGWPGVRAVRFGSQAPTRRPEIPRLVRKDVSTQMQTDVAPPPTLEKDLDEGDPYLNEDEPLYKCLDGEGSTVVASLQAVVQPIDEQGPDISKEWTGLAIETTEPASVQEGPVPFGWPGVRAVRFGSQAPARRPEIPRLVCKEVSTQRQTDLAPPPTLEKDVDEAESRSSDAAGRPL